MLDKNIAALKANDIVSGPYLPEPVQVLVVLPLGASVHRAGGPLPPGRGSHRASIGGGIVR